MDFNYSNNETGRRDFDIDDIWAEAYAAYKSGEKCELTKGELRQNELNNERFRAFSMERELIERYYEPGTQKGADCLHLSATEMLQTITKLTGGALRLNVISFGKELGRAGFKKAGYNNRYGYWVYETERLLREKSGNNSGGGVSPSMFSGGEKPEGEDLPF